MDAAHPVCLAGTPATRACGRTLSENADEHPQDLIAAGIHLLPRRVTRRLVRWFSVWGLITKPDQNAIDGMLDSIRLIDRKQMRQLFPDAEIRTERFLGLTKSLIAIRR